MLPGGAAKLVVEWFGWLPVRINGVQSLEASCRLTRVGGKVLLVQFLAESDAKLEGVYEKLGECESLKLVMTRTDASFDEVADAIRSNTKTFRLKSEAPANGFAEPPAYAFAGTTLREIERGIIEKTIESNNGSIPKAARELDISPSTIYRKIESWSETDA